MVNYLINKVDLIFKCSVLSSNTYGRVAEVVKVLSGPVCAWIGDRGKDTNRRLYQQVHTDFSNLLLRCILFFKVAPSKGVEEGRRESCFQNTVEEKIN